MKIRGGQAKRNGVMFFNEDRAARAVFKDGQIKVIQEKIEKSPLLSKFKKIPFLRGNILLFEVNVKLVLLLVMLDLVPWGTVFPSLFGPEFFPDWVFFALFGVMILILRWRYPRLWQYHGAEHKVVNAQQKRKALTLEAVRAESRVANDCGTNLIVFVLPLYLILVYGMEFHDVLAFFISLGVGYELFRLDETKWTGLTPFYAMGSLIQKHLVTIEPSDEQIEVALMAFQALDQESSQNV